MSNPFHVPARDASVAQIRAAYETAFGRPPAAGDDEIADCVAELVRDAEAEGAPAPTVNDAVIAVRELAGDAPEMVTISITEAALNAMEAFVTPGNVMHQPKIDPERAGHFLVEVQPDVVARLEELRRKTGGGSFSDVIVRAAAGYRADKGQS